MSYVHNEEYIIPKTNVVSGGRGSGVSTILVMESAEFNIPIVTTNTFKVEVYLDKAKELGLEIPNPININSLNNGKLSLGEEVIVDDGILLLQQLLQEKGFKAHIRTFGYTLD